MNLTPNCTNGTTFRLGKSPSAFLKVWVFRCPVTSPTPCTRAKSFLQYRSKHSRERGYTLRRNRTLPTSPVRTHSTASMFTGKESPLRKVQEPPHPNPSSRLHRSRTVCAGLASGHQDAHVALAWIPKGLPSFQDRVGSTSHQQHRYVSATLAPPRRAIDAHTPARFVGASKTNHKAGLGLPPIRIEFVELEGRLWQKSLCRPDINFSNDIEYVMLAFRRIRYGQAIEIKAPKACWTFTFRWFSDVSAEATTQQVSFGSQTDDTVHQSGVDTFHILLENMLDNLEGPSAAQLRLERFANWCECYEHQHHRRRVGHKYPDRPGRFGGIYNRGVVIPMYDRCFEDRKIGFAMYNLPVAEGQQIMSLPLQDCWKLTWPQGIPTKLSEEYRAMQQSQYGHDAMIVAMAVLRGAVPPLRFRCPTCLAWRTCTGPA